MTKKTNGVFATEAGGIPARGTICASFMHNACSKRLKEPALNGIAVGFPRMPRAA